MAQAVHVPSPICGPNIHSGAQQSTNPIQAAYADFCASLTRRLPRAISVDPSRIAFEDRAEHVNGVFTAVSIYVDALLDDAAQNIPGGVDRRQIDALLFDLGSEVTSTLQKAADDLAGRPR
jgi:hypothetical protein